MIGIIKPDPLISDTERLEYIIALLIEAAGGEVVIPKAHLTDTKRQIRREHLPDGSVKFTLG